MPLFMFSSHVPSLFSFTLLLIFALCVFLPLSVYVQNGYTALEAATAEGKFATAQLLREAGARLNVQAREKKRKAPTI